MIAACAAPLSLARPRVYVLRIVMRRRSGARDDDRM